MKRLLLSLLALVAVAAGARADDMKATPLTFEAITDGDITFSITYSYIHPVVLTPVEYKINDGSWTTYASWPANAASIISGTGNWPVTFGDAIHVTAGDKVSFRGDNASYYGNGTGYESHITSTADVYVYGNMMSLVDADDFVTLTTLTGNWNFAKLFNAGYDNEYAPVTNTTIKSHATNDLVLPATMITSACYFGMFAGCQGITRAPELPATTLESQCYAEMFRATGLTTAPALPATEMRAPYFNSPSDYSEGSMDCYMQMFQDCTSLTVAPALPATTVVHGVYQSMFAGCTSLVNAPVLPAAKVADGAYYRMFYGCTSLNFVRCFATDISADYCTTSWMSGVAATGTFVKAVGMDDWAVGPDADDSVNGIPNGWTVKSGYAYTVPTSGVGTFSAEDKVEVPEGLTAHYCTTYDKDGGKIAVETIDGGVVPANTGVLLRGTAGETYTLLETAAAAPSIANNTLVAVVDATHVDPTDGDYTNFILKGGKFVKVATSTSDVKISANKAYLHVLTSSLSRDAQTIGFDWDGTTSINTVQLPQPADGTVYDLQGRKVNGDSMRKGLYIVNGKKIVVK